MSRVGKQIIEIPSSVTVNMDGNVISVKGPKGELTRTLRDEVTIKIEDGKITSEPRRNDKFSRSLWGTYMSIIKAMIEGVQNPFVKKLIVEGVGFKWELNGSQLKMSLGFSHPVLLEIPKSVEVVANKGELTVTGIDKEEVTLFAMQVRKQKRTEPYKGKGIRYSDEIIRRKEGKKSA
ncbi:MAG: large subunit ribosomal protein [Patescibacteria group bacterium]|nr:large subunit ribosomal protein [Patescibacteria group bacterium]